MVPKFLRQQQQTSSSPPPPSSGQYSPVSSVPRPLPPPQAQPLPANTGKTTTTPPLPNTATQDVNAFCIAKTRILKAEEETAAKRKPLQDRLKTVRETIRKHMENERLSCLAVQLVEGEDLSHKPVQRYIRFGKTRNIGVLTPEKITQAIQSITPNDLKEQYQLLKEKLSKSANQKKRKRAAVESDEEDNDGTNANGAPSATISILDVWEAVAGVKIREAHLEDSIEFKLDKSKKRGQIPPVAPANINALAQEWLDLSRKTAQMTAEKNEKCEAWEQTVEEKQPIVTQYLQQQHPVDKCQEIMLNYRGENKPYVIREKESVVHKPVRITIFRPLIRKSLEETLQAHREVKNLATACNENIKRDLIRHLINYYGELREKQTDKTTYVSLDRLASGSRGAISDPEVALVHHLARRKVVAVTREPGQRARKRTSSVPPPPPPHISGAGPPIPSGVGVEKHPLTLQVGGNPYDHLDVRMGAGYPSGGGGFPLPQQTDAPLPAAYGEEQPPRKSTFAEQVQMHLQTRPSPCPPPRQPQLHQHQTMPAYNPIPTAAGATKRPSGGGVGGAAAPLQVNVGTPWKDVYQPAATIRSAQQQRAPRQSVPSRTYDRHPQQPQPQPFQFAEPDPYNMPRSQQQPASHHQQQPHQQFWEPIDDDDHRRVKQRLLHEINELASQLKRYNYQFPPRPMSVADSMEEIQFEIDHGRSVLEMRNTVDLVKQYVPMFFQGIETLNNKLGPFLPIQGFTDNLLQNMHENPQKYTYVLERMYRRYYRKGSLSPLMEFLMVFVLPIFFYAAKQKFLGALGSKMASAGMDSTNKAGTVGSVSHTMSAAPEPQRSHYEPEPAPLPMNNIGPAVQPQPASTIGKNIFPPAMMEQPNVSQYVTTPVIPNLTPPVVAHETTPPPPQQRHQQQAPPPAAGGGGRRRLKPPSHGIAFPVTQQPLVPQPVPVHAAPQQPQPLPSTPIIPPVTVPTSIVYQPQPQVQSIHQTAHPPRPPVPPLASTPQVQPPPPQPQQQVAINLNENGNRSKEGGGDHSSNLFTVHVPPTPDKAPSFRGSDSAPVVNFQPTITSSIQNHNRLPPIVEDPAEDEEDDADFDQRRQPMQGAEDHHPRPLSPPDHPNGLDVEEGETDAERQLIHEKLAALLQHQHQEDEDDDQRPEQSPYVEDSVFRQPIVEMDDMADLES